MYGALSAAGGLLAGLLFACIALVGSGFAPRNEEMPAFVGALFGVGAIFILPIFYGLLGLLIGALGGALYNVFAGMVGGIEIDVA